MDKNKKDIKISNINNLEISKYISINIIQNYYNEFNKLKKYIIYQNIINKRNKNINLQLKKINFIYLFTYILFNLINIVFAEEIINNQNSIFLKTSTKGYQYIISQDRLPDFVYVNEKQTNFDADGRINIKSRQKINIVKLVWNYKLKNCEFLFDSLDNIIEVDLSEFDSSEVTTMKGMFSFCSEVRSINFNNINTSSLIDMSEMFKNCDSLTEINFSSFDTSKVTNMGFLFYECPSLYSFDLSKFNTSQVKYMDWMFFLFTKFI